MLILLGRVLFSSIFIVSGINHLFSDDFSHAEAQGVVMPSFSVPVAGLLALVSGLSVAIGYKAKSGAWGIVVFLVLVTFVMHNFWAITNPQERAIQTIMFMKNICMLGGALVIARVGAGPYSIDHSLSKRHF